MTLFIVLKYCVAIFLGIKFQILRAAEKKVSI